MVRRAFAFNSRIALPVLAAALIVLSGRSTSVVAAPVVSAPQVVSAPRAMGSRWQLELRPGELRLHLDPETGRGYWFFTYKVINRSGDDRMWAPRLDLLTDDGRIQGSGRDVPTRVVRAIHAVLDDELIEDQNQIIGEILQGIEHAKEGVVVWPARNLEVTELTIFISGLSGETEVVLDPTTGEDVVLRRTHWLRYTLPGDALPMRTRPVRLSERGWVMR